MHIVPELKEKCRFVDYAIGDYTLAEGSPLYGLGSDGEAIGDLRWATNPPLAVDEDNLPKQFRLSQNYPNPFNPNTLISYDLPQDSHVSLQIFDITGRQVKTLINDHIRAGKHQVTWNADQISSGIYLVRLVTGEKIFNQKITFLK